MKTKGFTLMELLVVILIIAVLVYMASASFSSSRVVRANEHARAMFAELTNAARLYNELYPESKVYGNFGQSSFPTDCPGCKNPCVLFKGFVANDEMQSNIASFALKPAAWGLTSASQCNGNLTFKDYKFVLCNPNLPSSSTASNQPDARCYDSNDNGKPKFAIMITPATVTNPKYSGKYLWMTGGYQMASNYL